MSIMEFVAIVGLMGPACIIHLVLPGNAPPDLHERQAPYSRNRLLFLASPMRSCYTFFLSGGKVKDDFSFGAGRKERGMIKLQEATRDNLERLWKMQILAFEDLLARYRDFDMSPGAESFETVLAKFEQPWTKYFFILCDDQTIGGVRVVDKGNGAKKRISPIWIMPEHRGKGYAQQAIRLLEDLYGTDNWTLDTIWQEKGNLHLYEKLGYVQTGRIDHIKEGMDIVYYEKCQR